MDEIKTKAPDPSGVFDHLQEKVDIIFRYNMLSIRHCRAIMVLAPI